MSLRQILEQSLFDQTDESSTVPLSIRLPNNLNNELEELTITLDKSKSFLLLEFIKAGISETSNMSEDKAKNPILESPRDSSDFTTHKKFMLNTNFNNNKASHMTMLENQEAAAFRKGWKEYICNLEEGDKVYLYQSGVGFVASGIVTGDLIKSEYRGQPEEKYSKKLKDFKIGFKAISAKEFKTLTGGGASFRTTMSELKPEQCRKLDMEIEKRMKSVS
uniref:EVE domain-containing protein n=1 Tax=SPHINX/BMMF group 1 DNA sequence TaxID=2502151 RepID=A0A8F1SZI2_9ZZZZ|nr:hypothetical protein [SPHINX/BMMF group 1 DNA sequence]